MRRGGEQILAVGFGLLCLVAVSGCGAATLQSGSNGRSEQVEQPPQPPSHAHRLVEPAGGDLETIWQRLEEHHHAEVMILNEVFVDTRQQGIRIFVLYTYSSFESWRGILEDEVGGLVEDDELLDEEREAWVSQLRDLDELDEAERSAELEFEICEEAAAEDWVIEAEMIERVQSDYANCMSTSTSDDPDSECANLVRGMTMAPGEMVRQCSDDEIWGRVMDRGRYYCGEDRVGVALFSMPQGSGEDDEAPHLEEMLILEGSLCSNLSRIIPFDVDGDFEFEVILEILWSRHWQESDRFVSSDIVDLFILEPDLLIQFERRVFSREAVPRGAERGFPDGRYWFELATQSSASQMVIERFTVSGPCEPRAGCSRFVPPDGALEPADEDEDFGLWYYLSEPCFPRDAEAAPAGCRPEHLERITLSYNRENNTWL